MAEKLLIMGESGTGKSTSLRNCDPQTTAVVNPVGKPLPFKGSNKFTMLDGETDARKICRWMKEQAAAGKKLPVYPCCAVHEPDQRIWLGQIQ